MTENDRLQAAQVALKLAIENITKEYGVIVKPFYRAESHGEQLQITPQIIVTAIEGWQPESAANGKKGDGKDE